MLLQVFRWQTNGFAATQINMACRFRERVGASALTSLRTTPARFRELVARMTQRQLTESKNRVSMWLQQRKTIQVQTGDLALELSAARDKKVGSRCSLHRCRQHIPLCQLSSNRDSSNG